MHYAHLNYSFVLTAAMRGLEAVWRPETAARNTHTQHFTNNYYHINIRIASDTNETTTIPIDRSSCSTTQDHRTWPTDRPTVHQGLRPWTPLGALPPDPRILALRARYFSLCVQRRLIVVVQLTK